MRLCFEVVIGVVTALTLPASDLPGGLFTVAAVVGLVSGVIPSYRASNLGIVDALRYLG